MEIEEAKDLVHRREHEILLAISRAQKEIEKETGLRIKGAALVSVQTQPVSEFSSVKFTKFKFEVPL